MRKVFLQLAILTGVFTQAQNSGYQGQKLTLGYNASSFLFFQHGQIPDGAHLSYKSEFEITYTTARNFTFGLSYYTGLQKYAIDLTDEGDSYQYGFDDYWPKLGYIPTRFTVIELSGRLYRTNFIAPAGLYYRVGVGRVSYNLEVAGDTLFTENETKTGEHFLVKSIEPYKGWKLSFHLGRSVPIGHRFFINTAMGVNFFRGGDITLQRDADEERNYLRVMMNRSLRHHNFAEIKIGFGMFIF